MDDFGLWKEAGVPADNPRGHREDMQAPLRKDSGSQGIWTPNLLWGDGDHLKKNKKSCYHVIQIMSFDACKII